MNTGSSEQSSPSISALANTEAPFFDDWAHILLVVLFVLLVVICTVVVFKCCKKTISRCTRRMPHYIVEVRPISPTPLHGQNDVPNSPVFCEDDTVAFQFSSKEPEVNERTAVNSENIDDNYECMNLPQTSKEYAYAYGHVHINAGYMNTSSQWRLTIGVEDDYYEYPQNRRSSAPEYNYAYEWLDPSARVAGLSASQPILTDTYHDKDEVDNNCYENYQTSPQESIEKENEMGALVYVDIVP